ncbi:MAG: hypothetical protein K5869_02710 [Saccharofermentans sp.]|nr:hypothetical protein [Saccharofermentans sp.]
MLRLESRSVQIKKYLAGVLIAVLCLYLIPLISLAAGFGCDTQLPSVDQSTWQLTYYAGVFSTAVTCSVNPSATMAILAVFGTIENAATYTDNAVLIKIANYLNGIPIIREMGKTPVANPYAAALLIVIAIAWIIIHSTAISEFVSKWISLDKLDRICNSIYIGGISLLPLVSNDALAANPPGSKSAETVVKASSLIAGSTQSTRPSIGICILTVVVAIVVTILGNFVYSCVSNWETIVAAIPVKGTSLIWQIVKAFIHIGLIVLQMFAPVVSVIVNLHLLVACIFLFRILKRTSQYYKDIYITPVVAKIFKRNEPVSVIEKRVPRKIVKIYPSLEIAISLFAFHGYARLAKRSRVWLIKEGDKIDLVYNRLIRKPFIVSWSELCEKHGNKPVYLEQCLRFLKIRTEDRKLEFVLSNRYKQEAGLLSETLGLKDFEVVKQEKKEAKQLKKQGKKTKLGEI